MFFIAWAINNRNSKKYQIFQSLGKNFEIDTSQEDMFADDSDDTAVDEEGYFKLSKAKESSDDDDVFAPRGHKDLKTRSKKSSR